MPAVRGRKKKKKALITIPQQYIEQEKCLSSNKNLKLAVTENDQFQRICSAETIRKVYSFYP